MSSLSTDIETAKHVLIALQVVGGLLLSVSGSTVYLCVLGSIVAAEVGVFLYFDALVTKQQQLLSQELDLAQRRLKDHFPEDVRDRLQEQEEADEADSTPVFDLHPEATVLFADLKGFTKWSYNRNPDDVFQLLEALYAAIDKLADKYKVYKVETIGDCYLAVAGAPTADPDHALHMAEFAQAMLECSNQLLQYDLEQSLSGTSQLQVRVGLHSGPVVLGVLRCAKQRLQIFGDTVNRASRMESTGQAGKIQISSATAHYLSLKHNKGHWLARRVGRVEAKGLGRVVTYWLDTRSAPKKPTDKKSRKTFDSQYLVVDTASEVFLENWLSYDTSPRGTRRSPMSLGPLFHASRSSFGPLPPPTSFQSPQGKCCGTIPGPPLSSPPVTQYSPASSPRSRSLGSCCAVGVSA